MGNCNSCSCTDKNEVSTFEVQVGTSSTSNVGDTNTGGANGGTSGSRTNAYQSKTKV
jgi:hypothetical protein